MGREIEVCSYETQKKWIQALFKINNTLIYALNNESK